MQLLKPLRHSIEKIYIYLLVVSRLCLEVVSRYRDPQLQVGYKLLIFVSFETKHLQFLMFRRSFRSQ